MQVRRDIFQRVDGVHVIYASRRLRPEGTHAPLTLAPLPTRCQRNTTRCAWDRIEVENVWSFVFLSRRKSNVEVWAVLMQRGLSSVDNGIIGAVNALLDLFSKVSVDGAGCAFGRTLIQS